MASPKQDLSEFFRYSRPKKKPCAVAFARTNLDDGEQAQLDAAFLHDPGLITAGAIAEWLAARGHKVSHPAVVSHRSKRCSCHD